jgi:hypothetical protein
MAAVPLPLQLDQPALLVVAAKNDRSIIPALELTRSRLLSA